MFEQDLNLRHTWIYNPKFVCSADEVIGRSNAKIMDPSCTAALTETKGRVIATGQPTDWGAASAKPTN